MNKYYFTVGHYDHDCRDYYEEHDQDAHDPILATDDADATAKFKAIVARYDFGDLGNYDARFELTEDGRHICYAHRKRDMNQVFQESLEQTWENPGEFATECVGVDAMGHWYKWTNNGGERGLYDERCMDDYGVAQPIGADDAREWFVRLGILEDAEIDEILAGYA